MKIRLKEMRLENFKGIKELDVKFSSGISSVWGTRCSTSPHNIHPSGSFVTALNRPRS